MLAAYVCYSPQVPERWKRLPWGVITVILLAGFVALQALNIQHFSEHVVGAVVVALLIYLSLRENSPVQRLLGSKPMVFLGIFSYSVYLMHAPLLELSWQYIFSRWDATPTVVFWSFHLITTALILLISYVFHCFFERPFFNKKRSGNVSAIPKPSEA